MYRTYIIPGGSTASRAICRSNKKEDTQENYATLDWLSTQCGLSRNLSLPFNAMFFIIHLSTNNFHLFVANCAPQCSVPKITACCLTLAITHFVLCLSLCFYLACSKKSADKASIYPEALIFKIAGVHSWFLRSVNQLPLI